MKLFEVTVRMTNGDFMQFENVQIVHGVQNMTLVGTDSEGVTFEYIFPYNNLLFISASSVNEQEVLH